MKMKWIPEYNTGIDVIDDQHKRILDYINEIVEISDHTDKDRIKQILDNIIDYTQSHFTFEESLQEEADYKYRVPHKRVHDLFIKKIESYELPSDDDMLMQAVDQMICEVCMFNEHCYMGMCIANEEWREGMRKTLFNAAKGNK